MQVPTHAPPPPPAPPANRPAPAAPWLRTALTLGILGFTVVVLVAADWRPLLDVDRSVANRLHARALAHPGWTETNRVLTDWVWDPVTMRLVLLAAAVWVWLRRERLLAVWCVATAAVSTGVQQGLKALLDRERPHWRHPVDSAHFAAMPSGHAMTAAVVSVLVVWLVQRSGADRPLRVLVIVAACVSVAGVCLTRAALGVHWLTDTLVGALLGAALAAASAGTWNAAMEKGSRRSGTATG
ncbi:phosphatase PAP2 family protein [Streptomyces winkii]|uniref:phosphatase PAP2 family protein n=1 Tax=Streptomyces winkii TaxID=3051178 RepID=UPI0028D354AA|nr:phosphatase PAP2 family protein [Streptomyces sp. DSM 40971]